MNIFLQNCTLKFGSWTYDKSELDLAASGLTPEGAFDFSHFDNSRVTKVFFCISLNKTHTESPLFCSDGDP